MHRLLKKDQILTIPNLLSLVRLALIPVIVWLYTKRGARLAAVIVIVLSGLTDIADGIIARRFGMVSDFGKILDPVADKLTQGAVLLCLLREHPLLWLLVALFVGKELAMIWMGWLAIRRKDSVGSAKWHGKINTVLLYATMALLILVPGLPGWVSNGLIGLCAAMMVLSLTQYAMYYRKVFREN